MLGAGLFVLGLGAFLSRDLIGLLLTPDDPVSSVVPLAPTLSPAAGETIYRIDPERSRAVVSVQERLAGVSQDVELTTQAIAGDIGVPGGDPSGARIGEVVVDVHQLTSDNALRDKAIRHQYLASHDHPTVRLVDARVEGLPADTDRTGSAEFAIVGDLVVKGERHPVRWKAQARIQDDTLTATARTTVKMSDLGVGPITKVGLVSTSNDVGITLRLVAVDGSGFEPVRNLSLERVEAGSDSTDGPSFAKQVQPVLEANCASCHQSGSAGAASWTLDDAGDAASVADGLAVVTGSGYMPPWPPSEEGIPLQHPRRLSADDVAMLKDWAKAGGRLDVPRSTRVRAPSEPEVSQPDPDLTLALPEAYQGSPAKRDDYRCFVLDPGFTTTSFMTGYTFEPDQPEVVHHALVYRHRADSRAAVDARDASDPGSGFECVAGVGMGAGTSDLVGGWVPGQRPLDFAPGDGFDFQPGDFLVAQIHYHYEGSNPPDRSAMTLELADDPAGITPLQTRTLIAPVEMPCPPGSTAPLCDRNLALDDAAVRFGLSGRIIPDALHKLCGTTPEGVAAASDGTTARTTCDYRIGRPGQIIDVLGHMHELGLAYRMTLNPGRPDQKVLLDIPVWNFDWQLNYQPVEDVMVERGDTIRVECSWDRSLRYDPEPRYIFFAEGTEDEMCFSTITVRPPTG